MQKTTHGIALVLGLDAPVYTRLCANGTFSKPTEKMFQRVGSTEVELTCKTPLPVDTGLSNSAKDYTENNV